MPAPLSIDLFDPHPYRRTAADRIEQFAFRYGRSYDAYLTTEPGRELFWSRDGQGVVAFARRGRYLHVGGGLLADEPNKPQLLAELVDYAAAESWLCRSTTSTAKTCRCSGGMGFRSPSGAKRRSSGWPGKPGAEKPSSGSGGNRTIASGIACRSANAAAQALAGHEWSALMREMSEIAGGSPDDKPQSQEIRFMQGAFDPRCLGRKRIFIARSQAGAGRLEGFLVCNPGADGKLWVFEVYRHRPDAVRGTVAFLMHQAMQVLAREGVEQVSLCMVPGLNCAQPLAGDSPLLRRSMVWGTRYFSFIFDTAGLYHFKSRFRPQFESRYVCVFPKVTLGSALAFVGLLNVLKLDGRKSLRIALDRLRKWALRSTLADHPTVAAAE